MKPSLENEQTRTARTRPTRIAPVMIHPIDRWRVAKLVDQEVPYRRIYDKTGVSTATITRVARCLTYGDGYRRVLDRRKEQRP